MYYYMKVTKENLEQVVEKISSEGFNRENGMSHLIVILKMLLDNNKDYAISLNPDNKEDVSWCTYEHYESCDVNMYKEVNFLKCFNKPKKFPIFKTLVGATLVGAGIYIYNEFI